MPSREPDPATGAAAAVGHHVDVHVDLLSDHSGFVRHSSDVTSVVVRLQNKVHFMAIFLTTRTMDLIGLDE